MKDKKTFGSFIKEKRINKNYSQKDLADLLYVTESAVSKWERGVSYPDITLITNICRILEISEKELIQSSDDDEYRKIKKDSDKYNELKKTIFWILNICYITAILTCFIVNIAVNHTLSWFFIVLAAILTAYSFVPTFTWINTKYKKLSFISTTFVSLFFLFLTCSIYTNNYWFMIPTVGLLLFYFIIFYPILFNEQRKHLDKDKYKQISKWFLLSYSIIIFLLIILLLIIINSYKSYNLYLAIIITSGCFIIPFTYGILCIFKNSKFYIKLITIILTSFVVVFTIISISRGIYLQSSNQTNNYIITQTYNNINIDVDTEDINLYLAKDNEEKIVFKENKKQKLDIQVIDNTLIIKRIDNRKFYDLMFNFNNYDLDLYLSKDIIESLIIDGSTCDITINQGFTFNDVNIHNSTGNIKIKNSIAEKIYIENSTGDIDFSNCNDLGITNIETSTGKIYIANTNFEELNVDTTTGDVELSNVVVSNDFKMIGSTSNLYLDGFDANNIEVTLSTGDVKGTILTSKFFIAKSDTGVVKVPETREGGECRITVDTGNIIINYRTNTN